LVCRLCAQEHRLIHLRPGERALCSRCGAVLARRGWFGRDAALAFSLTGLVLAFPAALLPFVTVSKLRGEHVAHLFTGVSALWGDGMRLLAVWVFLCGTLAPVLLLCALAAILAPHKLDRADPAESVLRRLAHALEHWAMPEVHVLAVLVSLIKLGSLVDVSVGPGFWCYVALSFTVLIAWRSFDFDPAVATHAVVPTPHPA
jgi:paraquat-inducible protein A